MGDSFCSKEHSEIYEQEQSNVAFQRVMGTRAQSGSNVETAPVQLPAPQAEFTGSEWAQTAEAFASAPAPQALEADSPATAGPIPEMQETEQEWALRKDLTAMLEVAQHPMPMAEAVNETQFAGSTVGQSNATTAFAGSTMTFPGGRSGTGPAANLWGKAARSLLYPGNEPADMASMATAMPAGAAPSNPRAAGQPTQSVKSWTPKQWTLVGVAAGCSILAVGALLFGPLVKPVQAPQSLPAVRVTPNSPTAAVSAPLPPATPAPAVAKAAPTPKAIPAPVPVSLPAGPISHASLVASDPSWVVACADNKVLFAKLFTAGATQEIAFTTRAVVRIGRPAAIHVAVGGTAVPPPSGPVQVSLIELTPGGARYVENGAPNDCTHGL